MIPIHLHIHSWNVVIESKCGLLHAVLGASNTKESKSAFKKLTDLVWQCVSTEMRSKINL